MNLYPESPSAFYPYDVTVKFNTLVNQAGHQTETLQLWDRPLKSWKLTYGAISKADVTILWDFYVLQRGRAFKFQFYHTEEVITYKRLEDGDGVTVTFDVLARDISGLVVYVDGVEQTLTTDYNISLTSGPHGSAQVTFLVAPADTYQIRVDFTGENLYTCLFSKDSMSTKLFNLAVYSTGLEFDEVL